MRHAQCLIRNIGRGRHFWILNVLICQQTSKTWSPEDVFPTSSVQATLEKGQGTQTVTELYKLWQLPGPISNDLHMGWSENRELLGSPKIRWLIIVFPLLDT